MITVLVVAGHRGVGLRRETQAVGHGNAYPMGSEVDTDSSAHEGEL